MALMAAGENPGATAYLKDINETEAIKLTAPILAISALGEDPRVFGGQNLVALLKNTFTGGQLGDATTLNDDIFGLLALVASGEPLDDAVVAGTKNFITSRQNTDGGWGIMASGASDTNMTAMAIMALKETGGNSDKIDKAVAYLKNAQNSDGGFPYDPASSWSSASDASSDAWVISAIYKLGQDPYAWTKNGQNPVNHLKTLLTPSGYFSYQTGSPEDSFSPVTTSYAVIALSGKWYPVQKINAYLKNYNFRIEGLTDTICTGEVRAVTALDIVKNAQELCSYTYLIENLSFGPYLKKINNDEASGLRGWLYLVNYVSPTVGANDYQLQENDEVIWYFGEWTDQPTQLALDKTEAGENETVTATVTYYNQSSWQPLASAKITGLEALKETDANGQAALNLASGYYQLAAEKNGFVRSNSLTLKVGTPRDNVVSLKVEVDRSGVAGDETGNRIAFSVEPGELNFGKLKPGESKNKNLKIINSGQVAIDVEARVAGDELFRTRLKLNEKHWLYFASSLEQNQNQEVTAELSVPSSYSGPSGQKQGALVLWARAR